MDERKNGKSVAELMIIIDGLTREEQDAICLAISNIDVIRAICRNPGTTRRGMEEYLEKYKQRNDYMGQILAGLTLHYMDTAAQEQKPAVTDH